MTIDISKIRPGDEVTVRVKVIERHPNPEWPLVVALHPVTQSLALVQPGRELDGHAYVGKRAIVSHTPKAFQPGDRVRPVGGHDGGRVLASDGEFVWVRLDQVVGRPLSYRAHELERV